MLESILRPVCTCTTEESPVDLPPARSFPFSTPVSKANSFVPDAKKASWPGPGCLTWAWARHVPHRASAMASPNIDQRGEAAAEDRRWQMADGQWPMADGRAGLCIRNAGFTFQPPSDVGSL